jgi:hypothetical protein
VIPCGSKLEGSTFSETSLSTDKTLRCHNPEECNLIFICYSRSQGLYSSVSIVTRLQVWRLWTRGSIPGRARDFFSSPKVQTVSRAHPASCTQRALYLRGCGVKLTTHLHPVPTIRISGAVPPYSHMPSWSAQEQVYPCEIWGSHSGAADDSSLLVYEAVSSGFPTFRRFSAISSRAKQPKRFCSYLYFYCRLHLSSASS